ncbi:hypothetical protein LXL04_037483 [Taraxacum kok-saghyz]
MWAKKLGKEKIIAETDGGQHGVAIATICARLGLKYIIYMGAQDLERQALNMFRMKLLGAEVRPIDFGTAEQQDATSEAIQDWETNLKTTHFIFGSDVDQHPYPIMARKFVENKKIGFFEVKVVACGVDSGEHATTSTQRVVGVFHGQIIGPQSTSAGLDNRDVGPEHVFLKNLERDEYYRITDKEAREAFERLFKLEGIIPALETSYALAYLEILCPTLPNGAKSKMSDENTLTQIPKFDGHYDHWSELMENLLRAKGLWNMIADGFQEAPPGIGLTPAQKKQIEDKRQIDHQVKHYLFQAIDRTIFEQILDPRTSKIVWESMKKIRRSSEEMRT